MNKVSQKSLLNSKWTRQVVSKNEKHFIIVEVEFNEVQKVSKCIIEAIINKKQYELNWRELKNPSIWKVGWQ